VAPLVPEALPAPELLPALLWPQDTVSTGRPLQALRTHRPGLVPVDRRIPLLAGRGRLPDVVQRASGGEAAVVGNRVRGERGGHRAAAKGDGRDEGEDQDTRLLAR
jgi:hypothetical protein